MIKSCFKTLWVFLFALQFAVILPQAKIHFGPISALKRKVQEVKNNLDNAAPTLTQLFFTGETNYVTDGLNPETGRLATSYIYRVKYKDAEGDAPAAGYPRVHILKGGAEITSSPFAMSFVSGDFINGAIYTHSQTVASTGDDYTYFFEARDVNTIGATGATTTVNAPDVADWHIETVESGGVGLTPAIAVDTNGSVHISHYASVLRYAKKTGSVWALSTIDSVAPTGFTTSMALDSAQNPRISYYYLVGQDLKYAAWNGTSWDIETVDSTGNTGLFGSIELDSSDNAHISYRDVTNSSLKYTVWNGTSWDIETVDSTADVGVYTSLKLDSSQRPHIAYRDATNDSLKYAAWNGTSWDIETVDNTVVVDGGPSLDLDSSNNAHISYYDATNNSLKYAVWNGTSWDIEIVDNTYTSDTSAITFLELDSSGYPHIAYYNSDNLKYAVWNGASWDVETVDGASGGHIAFTLDSNDNPHIGYAQAGGGALKYARFGY